MLSTARFQFILTALVASVYAVVSNLFFYVGDHLNLMGVGRPSGWGDRALGWVGVVLQPWLYVGYWLSGSLGWPFPHSSVGAALVSGIVSAFILTAIFGFLVRRFPSSFWPVVGVFTLFAISSGAYYVRDLSSIRAFERNPPRTNA